jgi:hypothetical protein
MAFSCTALHSLSGQLVIVHLARLRIKSSSMTFHPIFPGLGGPRVICAPVTREIDEFSKEKFALLNPIPAENYACRQAIHRDALVKLFSF